ncbi:hypothetical protein HNV12_01240 [Methanococcoides sp. SA1]|nr:hypothetical protein [Methanococcoides sp. SA1]
MYNGTKSKCSFGKEVSLLARNFSFLKRKKPMEPQKEEIKQPTYSSNLGLGQKKKSPIPPQFIPTKKFATILGVIILSVIALGLFQFPYASLISGNTDVMIEIGYPFPFLQFSLTDPGQFPLNITGFLIDLLIYLILSYAIDIMIGLMFSHHSPKSEATSPQLFENQPTTLAEKATKKVFENKTLKAPKPE